MNYIQNLLFVVFISFSFSYGSNQVSDAEVLKLVREYRRSNIVHIDFTVDLDTNEVTILEAETKTKIRMKPDRKVKSYILYRYFSCKKRNKFT